MKYLLSFFLFLSLTSFKPHSITPYPVVGYKEIKFYDETYQLSRSLLIWYPIEPNIEGNFSSNPWDVFKIAQESPISDPTIKKPVVVISLGWSGSPHELSWLINKLVYNNYIVLGIEHLDIIKGKAQINYWRPLDIRMALDKFTSDSFSDKADLERIGIAGFSNGGTTAIWVAGGRSTQLDRFVPGPKDVYSKEFKNIEEMVPHLDKEKMAQDYRDPRIKAAFVMAPAWAWIFDKKGVETISIPTFIIAPETDNVLVTSNNAGFFAKNIPNSIYQIIPGSVNHYVFITEPRDKKKLSKLQFLFTDNPNMDRNWIQFQVAEEASKFFNETLSKSDDST